MDFFVLQCGKKTSQIPENAFSPLEILNFGEIRRVLKKII